MRGQLPDLDRVIMNWFPLCSPPSVQRLVDSGKGAGEKHEKEPGKNPPGSVPGAARVCARQSDQTHQAAKALRPPGRPGPSEHAPPGGRQSTGLLVTRTVGFCVVLPS